MWFPLHKVTLLPIRTKGWMVLSSRMKQFSPTGYSVKNEHYETVAGAFMWTLGQALGDSFTPELQDAWASAYVLLADTMKNN